MEAPNFTEDGQQKTFEELLCSPGLTAGLHGQSTFISVFNSFLSVTAFLGTTAFSLRHSCHYCHSAVTLVTLLSLLALLHFLALHFLALILVALHRESSLHPPSKLLLRNLATTDLCVVLIAEPLYVAYWMSKVNEDWNICPHLSVVGFITSYILCQVSVATVTAISVDRLLALLLGLRYRQVVTLKRTYVMVITFWVIATVISAMHFWNRFITLWCVIILTSLCLVISICSYTKIFLILRDHQNQVQGQVQQPNQTNQLNIARYKKAVSSAIWLQLTLVACYLPFISVMTAFLSNSELSASVYHARLYAATLVYLNSSLNPILYCWKLEEVRQAVKGTIRQVLCHCFSS